MLTENEVGQLLDIPEVKRIVHQLHQAFTEEETELRDISLHDFLSGVLLAPSVALAQVDGTTSLFEELSLNKKARRFSKGGFFLRHDPVVKMIMLLQTRFQHWEQRFFQALKRILKTVVPEISSDYEQHNVNANQPFTLFMNSSYILIRFLETFFLPEGEEISNKRRISYLEFQKITSIGKQLRLSKLGSFRNFVTTFEVK
jgi:hypothetical protein